MLENNDEYSQEELETLLKEKLKILNELEKVSKGSNYFQELSDIALIQLQLGLFEESQKNYMLCLKFFQLLKDRLGQASVYGLLGTLFLKKKEFKSSIENFKSANDIYFELSQIPEQITCLKGIGDALFNLDQLDQASDIFFKCSAIASDSNDIYSILDCLEKLISIYEKQEDWDVVYELYGKTLESFSKLKDNQGMIISHFNLGIIKRNNGDYEEAIYQFKMGTNLSIESNIIELIIKGLSYVGECFFYQGRLNESKNQYISALHLAEQVKSKNAILQIQILLKSFGMSDSDIEADLALYRSKKFTNKISE
ncbi:MAG: tetratricopeptide repeat protein [Candidatus Lokiarchaeota archaeon]|nr:tetratricopeptide repeat protein [Candidatus Lokiarchaeota archaeon]